jgi:hypothetical protein
MSEFNPEYELARRSLIQARERMEEAAAEYERLKAGFIQRWPKAIIPMERAMSTIRDEISDITNAEPTDLTAAQKIREVLADQSLDFSDEDRILLEYAAGRLEKIYKDEEASLDAIG